MNEKHTEVTKDAYGESVVQLRGLTPCATDLRVWHKTLAKRSSFVPRASYVTSEVNEVGRSSKGPLQRQSSPTAAQMTHTMERANDLKTAPEGALAEDLLKMLIAEANAVKAQAYCPYSRFRVGSALLTRDNRVFTGCNVENACYNLGQCAERNTIAKAVSEGCRSFRAIVVSSDLSEQFISPCGGCRQFMREFGSDWEVYLTKTDGSYLQMTVAELLPVSFGPEDLAMKKLTLQNDY